MDPLRTADPPREPAGQQPRRRDRRPIAGCAIWASPSPTPSASTPTTASCRSTSPRPRASRSSWAGTRSRSPTRRSRWQPGHYQGISLWGHFPESLTLGAKLGQMGRGLASLTRKEYTVEARTMNAARRAVRRRHRRPRTHRPDPGPRAGQRGHQVLVLEREPKFYGNARAVYTDGECMRIFQSFGMARAAGRRHVAGRAGADGAAGRLGAVPAQEHAAAARLAGQQLLLPALARDRAGRRTGALSQRQGAARPRS